MNSGNTHTTAALIAAAGSGSRLGRGPKAFVSLAGNTLLEWSSTALAPLVDEVIVAVPERELDRTRELLPAVRVVVGGASRQASVLALIESTTAEIVLVHDAARPFLPQTVARRVLAGAATAGAASAARPVADTLLSVPAGTAIERESLRSIQTPQGFRRELLLAAHSAAASAGRSATDDAGLVRAVGRSVDLVEGSPWLFKITTPEDLAFAESMATVWPGAGLT